MIHREEMVLTTFGKVRVKSNMSGKQLKIFSFLQAVESRSRGKLDSFKILPSFLYLRLWTLGVHLQSFLLQQHKGTRYYEVIVL